VRILLEVLGTSGHGVVELAHHPCGIVGGPKLSRREPFPPTLVVPLCRNHTPYQRLAIAFNLVLRGGFSGNFRRFRSRNDFSSPHNVLYDGVRTAQLARVARVAAARGRARVGRGSR
jgi:hypothetical protein